MSGGGGGVCIAEICSAASLARHADLSQMQVLVALPAPAAPRAQQLVIAAMLDEIAGDVRHQLGAAYAFGGQLVENRLAVMIALVGWIDPPRANEVIQLLRDRLAKLRDDPDAAARAVITARTRVVTSLAALTGSASLLVEQVVPLLVDVDLTRAAMYLHGPADPVTNAFALLGREAKVLEVNAAEADALDEPDEPDAATAQGGERKSSRAQRIRFSDIEEALTDQSISARSPLEINVQVTVATNNASNLIPPTHRYPVENNGFGFNVVGELGYRLTRRFSAGLGVAIGRQSSTYGNMAAGVVYEQVPYTIVPIETGAFFHVRPVDRAWAGFLVGAHLDQVNFDTESSWHTSFGLAFEAGYDIASYGNHWLALVARATASFGSDIGYGALAAGVAYRH